MGDLVTLHAYRLMGFPTLRCASSMRLVRHQSNRQVHSGVVAFALDGQFQAGGAMRQGARDPQQQVYSGGGIEWFLLQGGQPPSVKLGEGLRGVLQLDLAYAERQSAC